MNEEYLWYCSYGSNLSFDRFKLYLFGGSLPFSDKTFPGCSEKVDPSELQKRFTSIPFELFFSEKVKFWDDMGVAFLDSREDQSKKTYCRLYRINIGQFNEIVQQENSVFENASFEPIPLKRLQKKDSVVLVGSDKENLSYGKIINVGELEGLPIISFTSKWSINDRRDFNRAFVKPSKRYLTTIIEGLRESEVYGAGRLSEYDIFDYLSSLKGVLNGNSTDIYYSEDELRGIIRRAFETEPVEMRVEATGKVARKGEFCVQVGREFFEQGWGTKRFWRGVLPGKYCVLKRVDRFIEIQARVEIGDEQIGPNQINLDQKLRSALSVRKGDSILVYPLRRRDKKFPLRWRSAIAANLKSVLGIQYNLVRTIRSSYNDMEVNICRIKKETLDIIGIDSGDVVVIESPYGKVRRRALELTPSTLKEMEDRALSNDNNDFDCKKHLKTDRLEYKADIQPILLDFDTRNELKVLQCSPVRIRRSLTFEVTKRLHLISTPIILAIMAIVISFGLPVFWKVWILSLGLLIIFLFIGVNARMKV